MNICLVRVYEVEVRPRYRKTTNFLNFLISSIGTFLHLDRLSDSNAKKLTSIYYIFLCFQPSRFLSVQLLSVTLIMNLEIQNKKKQLQTNILLIHSFDLPLLTPSEWTEKKKKERKIITPRKTVTLASSSCLQWSEQRRLSLLPLSWSCPASLHSFHRSLPLV
jgi:hypothetical protein